MKKTLLILLLFVSFNIIAQSIFKKGYFITNNNEKIECLIKDENAYNIPNKFEYKTSKKSQVETINAENIRELLIIGGAKYQTYNVSVDLSRNKTSKLTNFRNSEKKEIKLLLRVLIEGDISLLEYQKTYLKRFFVKNKNNIVTLEYKRFKNKENKILINRNYQIQLKNNFYCDDSNSKIDYDKKELINYITTYSRCKNFKIVNLNNSTSSPKKGKLELRLRIGSALNFLTDESLETQNDYKSAISFKIGTEIEYVFGLNNYKWSLFLDPSFQTKISSKARAIAGYDSSFGGSGNPEVLTPIYKVYNLTYSTIEIPFGLRYRIYTKNKKAFFLNIGINIDVPLDNNITLNNFENNTTLSNEFESSLGFNFGVGYKVNDKINLDLTFFTPRGLKIKGRSEIEDVDFSNISLKLGYEIL